jgi:uncharacterized membrane protein
MRVVIVAAALWATGFSLFAIARHEAFQTNAFDLGYVTQMLWSTIHGQPFVFTTLDGVPFSPEGAFDLGRLREPHSLLAFHVEPILLLVAPLFAVWPDPRLLLVLQAVALASGALPAAALARRRLSIPHAAVVFGFAYLLSPSVAAAAMSAFHAVALAAPLVLGSLYLFATGRKWLAVSTAVLAGAAREDAAILVASLGAYLLIRFVVAQRRGVYVRSGADAAPPILV